IRARPPSTNLCCSWRNSLKPLIVGSQTDPIDPDRSRMTLIRVASGRSPACPLSLALVVDWIIVFLLSSPEGELAARVVWVLGVRGSRHAAADQRARRH